MWSVLTQQLRTKVYQLRRLICSSLSANEEPSQLNNDDHNHDLQTLIEYTTQQSVTIDNIEQQIQSLRESVDELWYQCHQTLHNCLTRLVHLLQNDKLTLQRDCDQKTIEWLHAQSRAMLKKLEYVYQSEFSASLLIHLSSSFVFVLDSKVSSSQWCQ
jgi:mevalonate kinase